MAYLPIHASENNDAEPVKTDSSGLVQEAARPSATPCFGADVAFDNELRPSRWTPVRGKIDSLFQFNLSWSVSRQISDTPMLIPHAGKGAILLGCHARDLGKRRPYSGRDYNNLREESLKLHSDYWKRCFSRPAGDYYKSDYFSGACFGYGAP